MEPKKISELIPDVLKQKSSTGLENVQSEKIERSHKTDQFIERFSKLKPPEKYGAIINQTKELRTTEQTVALPGRISADDEPEILYIMVAELFNFAGLTDNGTIRSVHNTIMDSYGWMALQDFALFFRKIKSGQYGEVYGKMNGMWITGKINNFQKSVKYNLALDKEAEHFSRKQMDGCRGLETYYNDVKPEIIE